jgi:hypothetical protein
VTFIECWNDHWSSTDLSAYSLIQQVSFTWEGFKIISVTLSLRPMKSELLGLGPDMSVCFNSLDRSNVLRSRTPPQFSGLCIWLHIGITRKL